jgi:phosphoglycerate dehydrogenase-like enzyme
MSEWLILKILEIYKKSRQFYKNQDQARWKKQYDIMELTGKVATIIGFGDVGIEVAKRLQAFGVYVVGIGRKNKESVLLNEYHTINELDKVLEKSDIIISSLPLTEETRHLIDKEKIKRMKDGCVFINVSRGGVIDEIALIEAIYNNKFLGVALDVFEEEPLSNESIWWSLENVIITPHNSFISDKINDRLFELIFKNLNENKVS